MEEIKNPVTIYRDDCPEGKIVEDYQADILVEKNNWKIKTPPIVSSTVPSMTIEETPQPKKKSKKNRPLRYP